MKILVVNYEFPPVGGGGGRATYKLAREWAREHHVDYVTQRAAGLKSYEKVDGINVYRVNALGRRNLDAAPIPTMLWYPVSGFACAAGLFARGGYDVINSHFAIPSGPLAVGLSALYRVPHVASIHGADIYDPSRFISPHRCVPLGMAVRWVLHAADVIVAQSTNTVQNALKYYGQELDPKMRIVPLAFDPTEPQRIAGEGAVDRRALGLEPQARYLISVGRLVRRKGFDNLIRALTQLPPQVRLLIIGSGPMQGELEEIIRSNGLGERVRLLGTVSDADKYRYLDASDIYVLSSQHEGFGIVLQEAMAVGLPIVSTSEGGQTDLLDDGVNAVMIESNAPERIAGAVRKLIEDPSLSEAMATANKEKIRQYEPSVIASQYLDVFLEVMDTWHCR